MQRGKRAAAALAALGLCLGVLCACGAAEEPDFALSVCLGSAPASLDPIRVSSAVEETAVTSLYENLLRIGADGPVAAAAKSYDAETNYDGTVTYTFRLRAAKWSDGVAVKAQDFVYAWQRLANPLTRAPEAALLSMVAGYDAVRAGGDLSELQVEAKNDATFVVTLTGVCGWFLTDVCTAPATVPLREDVVQRLKETAAANSAAAAEQGGADGVTWCSDPTKLVTNGPYTAVSLDEDALQLTRCARYQGTAKGPDTLTFRFADTVEAGWALYEEKAVDVVAPLPEAQYVLAQESPAHPPVPVPETGVVVFNTAGEIFADPQVRRAFSLTADRPAAAAALGVTAAAATGLVPFGVPDTAEEDFRTAGGTLVGEDPQADCAAAVALMDAAGYGGGFSAVKLLCPLQLQPLAESLAAGWAETLHVGVQVEAADQSELQSALSDGSYDMALTTLTGYANDAESFLAPWRTGDERNVTGYSNSAFDTLLTIINSASEEKARRGCLHDAESLLLGECPLTPIWFRSTAWENREGLAGVLRDARGWFSFVGAAMPNE